MVLWYQTYYGCRKNDETQVFQTTQVLLLLFIFTPEAPKSPEQSKMRGLQFYVKGAQP